MYILKSEEFQPSDFELLKYYFSLTVMNDLFYTKKYFKISLSNGRQHAVTLSSGL